MKGMNDRRADVEGSKDRVPRRTKRKQPCKYRAHDGRFLFIQCFLERTKFLHRRTVLHFRLLQSDYEYRPTAEEGIIMPTKIESSKLLVSSVDLNGSERAVNIQHDKRATQSNVNVGRGGMTSLVERKVSYSELSTVSAFNSQFEF
jgi:hypothetical protein